VTEVHTKRSSEVPAMDDTIYVKRLK